MLCYRCGSHVPDGSSTCGTCGQAFTVQGRRPSGPPRPKRKAAADVPGAFKVGERIAGRYEVKSVVGQGPVGTVYRAMDREVDVEVAVKVVTPKLLQSEEERETFRREARLVRALSHPNCVRLYEDGFDGDRPYLVMQYLEGLSLRKIIDLRHGKGQRFDLEEIAPILQQLCAALEHAHRLKVGDVTGVAHGHVKPQNVIVLPDLLKVVDFREACYVPRVPFVAAQRVRGGEIAYLAPEVVAGQPVTPASDLFALGVLLGEMLTGEIHEADRPVDLTAASGVPPAMDPVVRRLVAPRPEDRYRGVGELIDDVLAVVGGGTPTHAGAFRPTTSSGPPPAPPTDAQVLESGEFELLDEPVDALEDEMDDILDMDDAGAEIEADDADVPTMVADPDEVAGGVAPARPVGPVVRGREISEDDALDPEGGEAPGEPRKNTDEFAAELFGDMDEEDDVDDAGEYVEEVATEMPTVDGGYLDDEDEEIRTAVARRDDSDRVARPLDDAPAPAAGPEDLALATDPDGSIPPSLLAERPVGRGGWGAGRFLAVILVSAVAGLAAAVAISEDVRVAVGLAERPAPEPPPGPQPLDPPVPTQVAGTNGEETDPDPAPPSEKAPPPTKTPPPPTKADPPTKQRVADPRPPPRETTKVVAKTTPPDPPAERKAPADTRKTTDERRVASVTPQPGGDEERRRCPDGMVFVAAGSFQLGSAINDPMRNFAEHALSRTNVDAYCIDRYEYGGRGRRPVVGVTWYRAKELCEAQGRRLCTEEEWEKACKGPRNFRFPYGNTFDPEACNTEDAAGNPRDVAAGGSFNRCRSGYGVLDMAGNVAEWTATRFQPGLQDRTHKGGAANRPDWDTRCATRGNRPPNARDAFLGFRCCADPR